MISSDNSFILTVDLRGWPEKGIFTASDFDYSFYEPDGETPPSSAYPLDDGAILACF